jgi:CRP/FNR family transcriptional regulator, nitrogen fixation regulation protein
VFGLESAEKQVLTAKAITSTTVRVVKKSALKALTSREAEVADRLLSLTARELARKQDLALLLSGSAEDRVIYFLIEMSQRISPKENLIALPMTRQHIADYLGLTIETVSRILWDLERRGAIEITRGRSIVLRNQPVNGRAQTHRLLRAFEGIKGRLPRTEQEFEDWLASHEGKAATVFELTSLSRVRKTGRS